MLSVDLTANSDMTKTRRVHDLLFCNSKGHLYQILLFVSMSAASKRKVAESTSLISEGILPNNPLLHFRLAYRPL